MLEINKIELDVTMQCRAKIDMETVAHYAEQIKAGVEFPAVKVFYDSKNKKYWLADGWHRVLAHQNAGKATILEDITPGSRQDAIKYALGANASHGLRRTNADKHRCVEIALSEFPKLSSRAIAELCAVSHQSVENVRQVSNFDTSTETRIGRDGKQQFAKKQSKASKTKQGKAERPQPVEDAVANYTAADRKLDDLQGQVETLVAQNDQLRDAVAKATAPEGMDAESLIAELRARVKELEIENGALKIRRDTLMSEVAQLKRTAEYWRKRVEGKAA